VETSSRIDLTGKVAVVNGAGRGIGAAIAGAFAEVAAPTSTNEERIILASIGGFMNEHILQADRGSPVLLKRA